MGTNVNDYKIARYNIQRRCSIPLLSADAEDLALVCKECGILTTYSSLVERVSVYSLAGICDLHEAIHHIPGMLVPT